MGSGLRTAILSWRYRTPTRDPLEHGAGMDFDTFEMELYVRMRGTFMRSCSPHGCSSFGFVTALFDFLVREDDSPCIMW